MARQALDLREFDPVPEKVERPEKVSQSFLANLDRCPRSAYFYLRYGGGTTSHAAERGSAFHEMAERATRLMFDNREATFPPDMARELMQAVLDEGRYVVPIEEHESLRQMAWNWAKGTELNLDRPTLVEEMVELQVDDWTVRGKLDLAYLDGTEGEVVDYKTSMSLPKQERFERGFQGQFYALLLSEGRLEETGKRISSRSLDQVHVRQVYPRHYSERGGLADRAVWYDRADLADFRVALGSILNRLDRGLATGDFPAVPGTHCAFCPAAQECPIPQQFRYIESVENIEDAMAVAARTDKLAGEVTRLKASLRAYADANEYDAIPIGGEDADTEYGFVVVRSEVTKDKAALKQALADKVGDPEDFFTRRTSTKFDKRTRRDK